MKILIAVTLMCIIPISVNSMSRKEYKRYARENKEQIEHTREFNEKQILRMQDRHDDAVRRHYISQELAKERRHKERLHRINKGQ